MKTLSLPRWIALPAAALLALPGCQKPAEAEADATWWRLETDRIDLAQRVKLLEMKLAKGEQRPDNVEELKERVERSSAERVLLEEAAESLRSEVAALAENAAAERGQWIQSARAAAVGRSFDELAGARGRTYKDVKITAVTDIGVEFKHASGSARLAASDLTSEQKAVFGIDARISTEALKEEQQVAAAYGKWVDRRVATATAAAREEAAEIALAASVARPPRAEPALAAMDTSGSSRLRSEPRRVSRGYSTWYPTYTLGRYSRYRTGGSAFYNYPCAVAPAVSNFRVASGNWSYTSGRSGCNNTPVITRPRSSSFHSTP